MITDKREPKDKAIKFMTRKSQYKAIKAVAKELNCGMSEIIRDCIEYGIEKYYEVKEDKNNE